MVVLGPLKKENIQSNVILFEKPKRKKAEPESQPADTLEPTAKKGRGRPRKIPLYTTNTATTSKTSG
jgi:hypothetical protein